MDRIALVEQIKRHEGFCSTAYACTAGYITIGYGRNIDPDGGLGITEQEATVLLNHDIDRVFRELDRACPWWSACPAEVRMAMVDLAFNLGLPTFMKFKKMLAALQQGDWIEAGSQVINSRYARQVPGRAREIADQMMRGS